jgi:hypothetical protein
VKKLTGKILSFIGATLVMLPFIYAATSVIIYQVNRWEMMEKLEQQGLQTITLTSSDKYYWEEEGKEININGEMFDVESYSTQGAALIVTGLFDGQEDELNNHISAFFAKQDHNKNGNHSTIEQLVSLVFLQDHMTAANVTPPVIPVNTINLHITQFLLSVKPDTFTPPPRC